MDGDVPTVECNRAMHQHLIVHLADGIHPATIAAIDVAIASKRREPYMKVDFLRIKQVKEVVNVSLMHRHSTALGG